MCDRIPHIRVCYCHCIFDRRNIVLNFQGEKTIRHSRLKFTASVPETSNSLWTCIQYKQSSQTVRIALWGRAMSSVILSFSCEMAKLVFSVKKLLWISIFIFLISWNLLIWKQHYYNFHKQPGSETLKQCSGMPAYISAPPFYIKIYKLIEKECFQHRIASKIMYSMPVSVFAEVWKEYLGQMNRKLLHYWVTKKCRKCWLHLYL